MRPPASTWWIDSSNSEKNLVFLGNPLNRPRIFRRESRGATDIHWRLLPRTLAPLFFVFPFIRHLPSACPIDGDDGAGGNVQERCGRPGVSPVNNHADESAAVM